MNVDKWTNVSADWEPIPWDAEERLAYVQERGFRLRALKPLVWSRIQWDSFPEQGIFGMGADWFRSHEIDYVTTFDDENLVLIRGAWFGFPDPPEWGLASRPAGNPEGLWEMWGRFHNLPVGWSLKQTY